MGGCGQIASSVMKEYHKRNVSRYQQSLKSSRRLKTGAQHIMSLYLSVKLCEIVMSTVQEDGTRDVSERVYLMRFVKPPPPTVLRRLSSHHE